MTFEAFSEKLLCELQKPGVPIALPFLLTMVILDLGSTYIILGMGGIEYNPVFGGSFDSILTGKTIFVLGTLIVAAICEVIKKGSRSAPIVAGGIITEIPAVWSASMAVLMLAGL